MPVKKLAIHKKTARRWQRPQRKAAVLPTGELANSDELDGQSRLLASSLLFSCLQDLQELKDNEELTLHQRLQASLAIAKFIAGCK